MIKISKFFMFQSLLKFSNLSISIHSLTFALTIQLLSLIFIIYIDQIDSKTVIQTSEWPLRYHYSPWLHKEFIVRDQSDQFTDANGQYNGKDDVDDQRNFYQKQETCDDSDDGCTRCFTPSIHCERKMEQKNLSLKVGSSLTVDELLDISRLETLAKEQSRKTMTFQRCLYLNESLIDEMCTSDRRSIRKELLENLHLRSCRRFLVERSLSKHLYSLVINTTDCSRILKELLLLDNLVEELACEYESILHRYDCQAKWSLVWTCRDCKLAYRDWLCSVIIPYHVNGNLIKPCQSVCEQVQQKCPHLHPYGKGQYAGEPVFLCIDPNIPFNKKITPDIPFGDEGKCYNLCDLEPCVNEENEAPILDCPRPKPINNIEIELIDQFNESSTLSFDYSAEQFNVDDSLPPIDLVNNEDKITTEFTFSSTTAGDELDLSDNFYGEINQNNKKQQQSTINPPRWISTDEDDYVITSIGDNISNKQTQSLEFVEKVPSAPVAAEYQQEQQPIGNNIQNVQHQIQLDKKRNEQSSVVGDEPQKQQQPSSNVVFDNTESTSASTIDPQTFQDIYREAISVSTTTDSFDSISSNEQTQLLNDEFNKDTVIFENMNHEWTKVMISTMAPPSTTTIDTTVQTLPPTGTERNIDTVENHAKKNFYKYLTSGENGENISGNRFRHFNSRNKEKNSENNDNKQLTKNQQENDERISSKDDLYLNSYH